MRKLLTLLCLLVAISATAQKNNYYPAAKNWEHKSPSFFAIDSNKIKEAVDFAISHETSQPRNL